MRLPFTWTRRLRSHRHRAMRGKTACVIPFFRRLQPLSALHVATVVFLSDGPLPHIPPFPSRSWILWICHTCIRFEVLRSRSGTFPFIIQAFYMTRLGGNRWVAMDELLSPLHRRSFSSVSRNTTMGVFLPRPRFRIGMTMFLCSGGFVLSFCGS